MRMRRGSRDYWRFWCRFHKRRFGCCSGSRSLPEPLRDGAFGSAASWRRTPRVQSRPPRRVLRAQLRPRFHGGRRLSAESRVPEPAELPRRHASDPAAQCRCFGRCLGFGGRQGFEGGVLRVQSLPAASTAGVVYRESRVPARGRGLRAGRFGLRSASAVSSGAPAGSEAGEASTPGASGSLAAGASTAGAVSPGSSASGAGKASAPDASDPTTGAVSSGAPSGSGAGASDSAATGASPAGAVPSGAASGSGAGASDAVAAAAFSSGTPDSFAGTVSPGGDSTTSGATGDAACTAASRAFLRLRRRALRAQRQNQIRQHAVGELGSFRPAPATRTLAAETGIGQQTKRRLHRVRPALARRLVRKRNHGPQARPGTELDARRGMPLARAGQPVHAPRSSAPPCGTDPDCPAGTRQSLGAVDAPLVLIQPPPGQNRLHHRQRNEPRALPAHPRRLRRWAMPAARRCAAEPRRPSRRDRESRN